MTRINPLYNAFNTGEVSPRMLARVDIEKYANACETGVNLLAAPQGGFYRRPGTRYVAEIKNSANSTYLIPFEFSVTQAYIIEAGANYFRFFRNQGQITVPDTDASITNGTFDSDITGWTDQSGAGSSISHDATNERMSLTSNGTTNAHAEQSVSISSSFQSVSHVLRFRVYGAPGDRIKLRIGTSSTGTQLVNDLELPVGFHSYTFTPGVGTVYIQFLHSKGKTIQIDDVNFLDNVPFELPSPYTANQLAAVNFSQSADVLYIAVGGTTPIYKLQRTAHTSWSLVEVAFEDGPYLDQHLDDPILPSYSTTGQGIDFYGGGFGFDITIPLSTTLSPSATTGLGITITASTTVGINDGQGFLSTDIGRLIRIQDTASADAGYAIITDITSTTVVTADVRRDFNAATATTRWWLGTWCQTLGYPSSVMFHDQRLVFAGSTTYPQTFWGSQSADIENHRPDSFVSSALTVEDDDAINFTIASRQVNSIYWMESARKLIIGTSGGQWIVSSVGSVLTPTDIDVKRHSTEGVANIKPVLLNEIVLFVQRALRKVYDFKFEFERDGYVARDVTILADHIGRGGIEQIVYQQDPDSIAWCVRSDGKLLALTYKPDQGVIGWTRHILGGVFGSGDAVVENIATIPGVADSGQTLDSDERNELWAIVKRTINGATTRYIEFVERAFEGPIRHDYDSDGAWKSAVISEQQDAFYVDSGLTYDGAATTSITGLDHLEGETVKVLADGAIHPDKTVSSGAITLDYSVSKVQAGLGYNHTYKSLKLAQGARAGTAVGKVKRIHSVTFVLLDTATFQFGKDLDSLQNVEFRVVADAMDTAVPLFTGEKNRDFNGQYDRDARIHVQSNAPLPFAVLAIAPELKTNEMV